MAHINPGELYKYRRGANYPAKKGDPNDVIEALK